MKKNILLIYAILAGAVLLTGCLTALKNGNSNRTWERTVDSTVGYYSR